MKQSHRIQATADSAKPRRPWIDPAIQENALADHTRGGAVLRGVESATYRRS